MNRKAFLTLATLGALVAIGVAPAAAQDKIEAKIPFAFNVGAKALPAGDYELQRLNSDTMVIREVGTREVRMVLTDATEPRDTGGEAVLVFNRYGQDSFLSRILTPDSGRALMKSKVEERAAARAEEWAENAHGPRVVYVAAAVK